jgi:hypothetical protein
MIGRRPDDRAGPFYSTLITDAPIDGDAEQADDGEDDHDGEGNGQPERQEQILQEICELTN